jgi:NAD(P)H-nitrite reductase large subunit
MSQCGGAGTGCGWCIPFLKQIFRQQQDPAANTDLDDLSAADYAKKRADYVRSGQGTPAPGATPLPPDDHLPDA